MKIPLYIIFIGYCIVSIVIITGLFGARELFISNFGRQTKTGTPIPAATRPRPLSPLRVRGSVPYWDQANAVRSLENNTDVFDSVSLYWYFLTDNGDIQKYAYTTEDLSVIARAHARKMKISAVITNLPEGDEAEWESPRVENMLKDAASRRYTIGSIETLIRRLGFDGVTIDFEEVDGETRENFSRFIAELSSILKKSGKFTGVALHPKTGEYSDKQYIFQDWNALAQSADELYIMAYNEHWENGSPGPVASGEWVKSIISYAGHIQVPLSKFYLGIPLFGYDWNTGSDEPADGLTYSQIVRLMQIYGVREEWGESTVSPFFRYTAGGKMHEVWFENAASIEEKLSLAGEAGFGGVTFWRLGGEDPSVWQSVREKKKSVSPP